MKRNDSTSKSMSQVARMFVYIALRQLQASTTTKAAPMSVAELTAGTTKLVAELAKLGVIGTTAKHQLVITPKGAPLVVRYLAAVSDDLRAGHFGKFEWSKRTKFHKEIMARLA